MSDRRDQLDHALDEALASYGEPPENEGLQRRILARVTERPKRAHPIRLLVLAGGAAVALIACLSWWVMLKTPVRTHPATTATLALKREAPRIQTIPVPAPKAARVSAAKPRKLRKKSAEPKLPQFPAPSPPSSEERALVQLVTHDANDISRELSHLGSPVKPIHIAAIEIKPLQLRWYTKEKKCCDQ